MAQFGGRGALFVIVPVIFALVGVMLIVTSLRTLARTRVFVRGAARAPGTVVGFRTRAVIVNDSPGHLDHPIVRYQPAGLGVIEFESPQGTSPRIHREGQVVTVLYDPRAPRQAQVQSGCFQYALPLFLIVMGTGFVVLAALLGALAWFIGQLPA